MVVREELEKLATEELLRLQELIGEILAERERSGKEFVFEFSATEDPRKGVPYVARLVMKDGKIEREFYPLEKEYGKKLVTVHGEFTARAGDIIEMREEASWKNDWVAVYLVSKEGELLFLGHRKKSPAVMERVKKYLKGELGYDELAGAAKKS